MAKKALKVCLTHLIIIQIEKNFKFFLSIVDWFDLAKKPSHATVPLSRPVLRIRNKSFGSSFGSGSGMQLVSNLDSNPGYGSRSETGQNFFFCTKIFTQPYLQT